MGPTDRFLKNRPPKKVFETVGYWYQSDMQARSDALNDLQATLSTRRPLLKNGPSPEICFFDVSNDLEQKKKIFLVQNEKNLVVFLT